MRWNSWCHSLGLAGLLTAALPGAGVAAGAPDDDPDAQPKPAASNPYQRIIDRNPFRLKDPIEEGAANAPTNPPPQTNVKFTGIYKVNGVTKACIAIVDPSVKAPNNPNRFYALAAGEMQDGVKVLEIDGAKETVKVDGPNGIATLNFKENGFQAAGAPPAAVGNPGGPAGVIAKQPGVVTAGVPPGAPPSPPAPVNAGFVNQPYTNPGGQPTAVGAAGTSVPSVDAAMGLRNSIPSRQVRTPTSNVDSGAATALIQYATMQEQAARMRASGRPPPPVPPLPAFMNAPSVPAPQGGGP